MVVADPTPEPFSQSSSQISAIMTKRCPSCGERFPFDYRVCPRDVVELEPEADEQRDRHLGQTLSNSYRIVRRIGIGGMGSVYEARHTRMTDRRLAVKIMHTELARKTELVTRFRREAEVASLAHHNNVLEVFDVDETTEGIPFIVAELLEGEDLAQRLERVGKLSLEDTVHVVRQLCAALSAAHAVGIVHRDMKPDNVFLVGDDRPVVKLLDFGIARLTDPSAANRTRTGVVMGTPAYMAPEQARGQKVDHRCDVYAVGAIVYRCLTGRDMYDHEDPAAVLMSVLTKEPDRPRAILPDLPEAAEVVIERAIARNPAERFQSMAELDAALASLVKSDTPVVANAAVDSMRAPDPTADLGRAVPSARPTIIAMTMLGLLLAVAVVVDVLAWLTMAFMDATMNETEGTFLVVGVIGTLAAPFILWIRFVWRRVWRNSLRAVALARRLSVTFAAATSTYALVLLAVRGLDLALLPPELDGPVALLGPIAASTGAIVAALLAIVITRQRNTERSS
jgi:tRNA A-37 threonylcarbamoyl transferase component Bud32